MSPGWLAMREPADASARAADLVGRLDRQRPAGPWIIHDLGSGTGSMARWLAPRLAGDQRWILYDRDADLLAQAAVDRPAVTDGATVSIAIRHRDITRLGSAELAGATLITASALLDMLTAAELDRLVTSCAGAGCPVLLTLSVVGRVELAPADAVDQRIADAFNDHQRRGIGGRRLLGPDAVGAAADAFGRLGHDVLVRPSLWRLGPADADLMAHWLRGWLAAAREQTPELAELITSYEHRRRHQASVGRLGVVVHHQDLLALPR